MTNVERTVLKELLANFRAFLSYKGCNDWTLEDTPENREFMQAVIASGDYPDDKISATKGKIYTQDYILLSYFTAKLEKES